MRKKRLSTIVIVMSVFASACAARSGASPSSADSVMPSPSAATAADCRPTEARAAFVPPPPFAKQPAAVHDSRWFGTPSLWTMLRPGDKPDGLSQKLFWWSADWAPDTEPNPAITVVARRLDGTASLAAGPGTNATSDFGTAMLVGVQFPTGGCWEVTGRYRGSSLSYVEWVVGG